MKARIRNKVFRNRWRMSYALGQIFEAARGITLWINPGNGYEYYINYHNGKVYKIAEEKYPHCPALFLMDLRRHKRKSNRRCKRK